MTRRAGGRSREVSGQRGVRQLRSQVAKSPSVRADKKRSSWRCYGVPHPGRRPLGYSGSFANCQAVRLGPVQLTGTSGGPTWTDATIPSGLGPLYAILRSAATNCARVTRALVRVTAGSATPVQNTAFINVVSFSGEVKGCLSRGRGGGRPLRHKSRCLPTLRKAIPDDS